MLTPKLTPFHDGVFIGGAINALVCLGKALADKGHNVSIVAGLPESEEEAPIREALSWAKVYFVKVSNNGPVSRGLKTMPRMLKRAITVCRKDSCDLVHGHSGYANWASLTTMVGFLARRPALHTLYCPLASTVDDKRNPILNKSIAKFSLSRLNCIVAISENIFRSLSNAGLDEDRIEIIPPAVDDQKFHSGVDGLGMREKLGIQSEEKVLLFVGNFTESKGLDSLFRALEVLLRKEPKLKLIYTVEHGPAITDERKIQINKLIEELGLNNRVLELGTVRDMPALMAASDIFVVPFRGTEGPSDYPIAMLEAMMIGRPVVATKVGAIPEIIFDGKTGKLVSPNNSDSLAQGIVFILGNPDRVNTMVKAGMQMVKSRFSPDRIAKLAEEVYVKVLNKG